MHNDFLTITVNGKEYSVRPNFKAAADIQARTGKTLAQSVFAARALSVVDLHGILCGALAGNGHFVDADILGDVIMDDYKTNEAPLAKQIIAFGEAFFPQVDNDGTKKQTATTQQAG